MRTRHMLRHAHVKIATTQVADAMSLAVGTDRLCLDQRVQMPCLRHVLPCPRRSAPRSSSTGMPAHPSSRPCSCAASVERNRMGFSLCLDFRAQSAVGAWPVRSRGVVDSFLLGTLRLPPTRNWRLANSNHATARQMLSSASDIYTTAAVGRFRDNGVALPRSF